MAVNLPEKWELLSALSLWLSSRPCLQLAIVSIVLPRPSRPDSFHVRVRLGRVTIPIRAIRHDWAGREPHQLFILSSLTLGIGLGFALALLVVLSRLFGWGLEAARPDLAQVHGQVQVLGFLGLFIIGMALRLMPRFAHTDLRFPGLVLPLWGLTVVALLARALVVIWLPDDLHSIGILVVELSLLVSAACFAAIVWPTILKAPGRPEATAWFFLVGSLLFLLQALLGSMIALREIRDDTPVFSYLPNTARLYLLLGGFVVAFIGGVSGRALPVMAGLPRSERLGRLLAVLLFADLLILSGTLTYLEYGAYSVTAIDIGNVALTGLGVLFAAIVWLSGVLRPAANRVRPASQPHVWLVRSAFAWLSFAAVFAAFLGVKGVADGDLPSFHAVDALRHTLGLGVATTLIAGMGLLILPEFAGERQQRPDQSLRSYSLLFLLKGAALLRVGSELAGLDFDSDIRLGMQAAAGAMAEFALILFAWNFLRLMPQPKA